MERVRLSDENLKLICYLVRRGGIRPSDGVIESICIELLIYRARETTMADARKSNEAQANASYCGETHTI